jgi:hypothetical protein
LVGLTTPFIATINFSDGSSQDISRDASWRSAAPASAAVDSGGIVTALQATAAPINITANFNGYEDFGSIEVLNAEISKLALTPSVISIPAQHQQQYQATVLLDNGDSLDVSRDVDWSIANSNIATISNSAPNKGSMFAVTPGMTTVEATLNYADTRLTDQGDITVEAARLQAIIITPDNPSVVKGTVGEFTASGKYNDGSERDITFSALWSSSNTSTATIEATGSSAGTAYAITPGTTVIAATLDGITGTTTATVTAPTLDSILVTPPTATIPLGINQHFQATGFFSDGSNQNLTRVASWSSSDNNVAVLDGKDSGRALTITAGTAMITATFDGQSDSATLQVETPVLTALNIYPTNKISPRGISFNYRAIADYNNNTSVVVTEQATWSSSDTATASISNAADEQGLARTISAGNTTIAASFSGLTSSTQLDVLGAGVSFITPRCSPVNINIGETTQCTCTARLNDGSGDSFDCTALATYTANFPGLASVSNKPGEEGWVTGLNSGPVNIFVEFAERSGNSSIEVLE